MGQSRSLKREFLVIYSSFCDDLLTKSDVLRGVTIEEDNNPINVLIKLLLNRTLLRSLDDIRLWAVFPRENVRDHKGNLPIA